MRKKKRRSASRYYPEADQRLCFRYIDSKIPLLFKSNISSLYPSSVAVQPGLCRTRSETRTLVFSSRDSNSVYSCKSKFCYMKQWVDGVFITYVSKRDEFTPFAKVVISYTEYLLILNNFTVRASSSVQMFCFVSSTA